MLFQYFILVTSLLCCVNSIRFNLIKDGNCPRSFRNQQCDVILCSADMDCPGVQKCCLTDCGGQACAKPFPGATAVTKPNLVKNVAQAPARLNQNKCPIVLNIANKTKANCLFDGCLSDANCLNGQICCDVQGCKKKACIPLTQVENNPKPVQRVPAPAVKLQLDEQEETYDDYSNTYYDYNPQYNNAYYGYDYNRNTRAGKYAQKSYGTQFNGPVMNGNDVVLPYQRNPFFKKNKKEFVNQNLQKYSIHPMSMRFKKTNIDY